MHAAVTDGTAPLASFSSRTALAAPLTSLPSLTALAALLAATALASTTLTAAAAAVAGQVRAGCDYSPSRSALLPAECRLRRLCRGAWHPDRRAGAQCFDHLERDRHYLV